MAYLNKIALQERTGGNIAGINVDTGISAMMQPRGVSGAAIRPAGTMGTYQIEILDAIEKFAKESDQARMTNEKIKVMIDIDNMSLDLEEKWAGVTDKFSNDEKYKEYLEDKKNLQAQKEKLINEHKFMTAQERQTAIEKSKLSYREDFVKTLGKRNEVVVKMRVDDARANLEQLSVLSSNLGIHDDGKAKEYYAMMAEQINTVGNLTGLTEEQRLNLFADNIQKAEVGRQQNFLEKLKMSDMPFQEKERQLKELKAGIENKELMMAYVKEMVEIFPTEDQEQAENFLYTKMTDVSSKIVNGVLSEARRIETEKRKQEAAQRKMIKAIEKQKKEQEKLSALMQNDPKAYYKATTGKKLTTQELLSNPLALGYVSDGSWEEYGDINNGKAFAILSSSEISEINRSVNYRKNEGMYTDKEIFEPVFDMARTLSNGDILKETAILKDYAMRNGMNPKVFLQGRNNPEYFRVNDVMRKGNAVVNETGFSINENKDNLSRKAKKNYETIADRFSDDEELGALMADQYIVGVIAKSGNLDKFKADPERFLNKALTEEKRGYSQIKKDIEIAASISSKRVDYKYDYIKTEKTKQKKETKKEQPKKSKYI